MPRNNSEPMINTTETNRSPAITGTDRLTTIYRRPGPYTSVYLATVPLLADSAADLDRRWHQLRADLEAQCAPLEALAAIEARLVLPQPDDTAAIAVIASADGTTIVEHGAEPPSHDFGVVDTLPYAAPLLEWHQRRVAHLVVIVGEEGADIATFGLDHYQAVHSVTSHGEELARDIAKRADGSDASLIVLAGDATQTASLADRLANRVGLACRVITEPFQQTTDDLAAATVRHVSDTAARATVRYLREHRFLQSHDAAVDGTDRTLLALARGTADVLLIHDDPNDQRRCWVGSDAHQLSVEARTGLDQQARLVDAAIRSAVLQGIPVHIIPTTGPGGPDDNAAALTYDAAQPAQCP